MIQLLNLFQGITVFAWIWISRDKGICFDLKQVDLARFVAGVVMLALGQALVRSSFSAIGRWGVYYGSKLSNDKRSVVEASAAEGKSWWCSLYKPHYCGTAISVAAGVVMLGPQLPPNAWFVSTFLSMLYAITAWMEYAL